MSLLLGPTYGRRILGAIAHHRVSSRISLRAGELICRISRRYTPGLSTETFLLWENAKWGDSIQVERDGFYRSGGKIAGNAYVSAAYSRAGVQEFVIDETTTPESLADAPRTFLRSSKLFRTAMGWICTAGFAPFFFLETQSQLPLDFWSGVFFGESRDLEGLLTLGVVLPTATAIAIDFFGLRKLGRFLAIKFPRFRGGEPSRTFELQRSSVQRNHLKHFTALLLTALPLLAFFEELVFRWGYQYHLRPQFGTFGSLIATSGLFAVAHGIRNPRTLTYCFGTGLLYGTLYEVTEHCLVAPIIAHAISNVPAVLSNYRSLKKHQKG